VDLFNGEPPAPRPAWRVIEAARNQRLTGELALPSNPPTNVYLVNGEVYFAERTTDGGIGVRLLVEGVITRKQMSKGSVMVSGAEHLGRLFERDESIDRHAVELCVELMTDDVLTSVSKELVDSYVMTLYKRHPSGIDRWLPNQSTADAPAVSEDQRAALTDWQSPVSTNGATPVVSEPVHQPVNDPALARAAVAPAPVAVAPVAPAPVVSEPVVSETVAPAPAAFVPAAEPVARVPERIELGTWPTEALPTLAATRPADSYPAAPAAVTPAAAPATPSAAESPHDSGVPNTIADEVADAVRRALAAIDSVLVPASDDAKPPPRPL
jgi:hypothetical protein